MPHPSDDRIAQTPARVSLRDQLGAAPDPDFALPLPTGWVRREPTEHEREGMQSVVRRRLLEQHRPDLYAQLRTRIDDAFQSMADASVVAFFTPATGDDEALALPASLLVSVRRAAAGETLDPLVRSLIRDAGATPLLDDPRFLRCERERRQVLDGIEFLATDVVYLTPIPGSQRRRGLQLTATIIRPVDAPADDRPVVLMKALFDLCVSGLVWTPVAAA